ncbi:DUF1565 domain-containing protein [Aequorivita marisscotiae]|uniref:DUF1565 domain-containing protein n=1 Tax=Aequorivita marisscotiae TaxID=3040348 RepID=A0ABY8KWC7_9FLAO|nr:DUF1565 domain-containing protein [Aequorivita sp. Ant34-E75]WGF92360.1 DUF1565 domain-containing protein [Aequorivita sp. Ant34-E75]
MKKLLYIISFLFFTVAIAQDDCIPIPNGNFQEWSGTDNPKNWLTTNMGDKYGTPNINFDMRNVFQTPGKFGFGVRIKNASILEMLKNEKPAEYAKLPASIKEQLRKSSFSGSLFTCQGNCEGAVLAENEIFMRENMSFPVEKAPGALCGYYKANLKEGDKLWLWPILFMENKNFAGGVMPGETASVISKSTGDWTPFRIPLRILPNRKVAKAAIQLQMVNSGFPVTPPYGMNAVELAQKYPSTDGSEVFIDELCFCGEADYIAEDDPILDGIDTGGGSIGQNPNDDGTNGDDDHPENLYVAMDGNDANSGSKTNPFATLQKALDVANGKRQQGKNATIIVRDGTYKQAASVQWGTSSLPPLKIKAENEHQAIFVGSEKISGNISWQNFGQDIYKASNAKLHPNMVEAVTDYSNPYQNSVPALLMNGEVLNFTQAVQQTAGSYFVSPQITMVHPKNGAAPSSSNTEVSVFPSAIKISGGGAISINGLRFKGYPISSLPSGTVPFKSGLDVSDNVGVANCLFK